MNEFWKCEKKDDYNKMIIFFLKQIIDMDN